MLDYDIYLTAAQSRMFITHSKLLVTALEEMKEHLIILMHMLRIHSLVRSYSIFSL